jgi:hypothetical protein
MQRTSIVVGVVIGVVVVVGIVGTSSAVDKLNGPGTPEVSVERINDTHAAVAWTTKKPTQGHLRMYVSRECGPGWGKSITSINDSSFTRTHLVVAPIYDLNKSQVNLSRVPGNGSLKQYQVEVSVFRDSSGASKTILKRNLTQACG